MVEDVVKTMIIKATDAQSNSMVVEVNAYRVAVGGDLKLRFIRIDEDYGADYMIFDRDGIREILKEIAEVI